ncbi:hypothetical protein [Bacillus sp. FJAT-45037]|uniref:hypothetical protein n=1 Tax=Bacillus sp. FJAT-45037 TaxID=2011007 RepID=UPI000C234CB5|nr:hypothetical protein [Bacillus sp. FJAT-45037]
MTLHRKKMILIYQEYESLNYLLEQILSSRDFVEVHTITDLRKLSSMCDTVNPDIVLFEAENGYQLKFLQDIEKHGVDGSILSKIVYIVGRDREDYFQANHSHEQAVKILKPFDINAMIETLEQQLNESSYLNLTLLG